MIQPRFFEYDYNSHEVIEYQRSGECNHCGECCTTRVEFNGINHARRGVWGCAVEEGKPDFFQQVSSVGQIGADVCSEWVNQRCRIHAIKLRMCRVWPMTLEQVSMFEHCSYAFTEIDRRPMTDEEV